MPLFYVSLCGQHKVYLIGPCLGIAEWERKRYKDMLSFSLFLAVSNLLALRVVRASERT